MAWSTVGNSVKTWLGGRKESAAPVTLAGGDDAVGSPNAPYSPGKSEVQDNLFDGADSAEQPLQPGQLSLEESAHGGLGRHLGVVSTTLLM